MPDEAEVLEAARALIRGAVDDPAARAAEPAAALPVAAPGGGALDSWFVPLADAGRLAGFLQLDPDLGLRRFSSFARPPDAASWIDTDAISPRARAAAGPEPQLGEPVLTYDAHPDRIAWAVPIADGSGRAVFVAGDHAWTGPLRAP